MLQRFIFIITLATITALAVTVSGGAFAAGHGSSGGHGGHFAGAAHFAGGGGPHFVGHGGRFIGGGGYGPGYAPGYYYGGGDYYGYPPDYGYYYEPDYGAAAALGVLSIISGIMGSHLYHHHCWLHHGRRFCR
jgi:hypothetical protein